ncbi:hypothetical protein GW931_00535 [archaeon]|nr:hypothetical protein [archaeon]
MKKEIILLLLLIITLFTINYSYLDSKLVLAFQNYETGIVERVIDGDTIVINGTSIRLLGINSPEKGEIGYNQAKGFLEEKILDKEVEIHFEGNKFDKYHRELAYIYFEGKNINLESVQLGYSNFYFPSGKTSLYSKFNEKWQECLENNYNLCERSNQTCLILDWLPTKQTVEVKNICNKEIDLKGYSIKDEGRKKYVFQKKIISPYEKIILTEKDWNETYVWTKTGDSIFFRDNFGKLIFYENY